MKGWCGDFLNAESGRLGNRPTESVVNVSFSASHLVVWERRQWHPNTSL